MSDIQPASFADLKKAWDFWRHHKDQDRPVTDTPNYRTYRLEFLRGIDQIKTQAKTEALQDLADNHTVRIPDILGDKVQAVFTETIWEKLDELEGDNDHPAEG